MTLTPLCIDGWEWATYCKDSPGQLILHSSKKQYIEIESSFSNSPLTIGIFFNKDLSIFLPAIKLNSITNQYLVSNLRILPTKYAYQTLLIDIYQFLSRLIPHDLNGKLMGVNGIYTSWKQEFPNEKAAIEDLAIIKESFEGLANETTFLSWLSKQGASSERVLTQKEIKQCLESSLRRLFHPPNSFVFSLNDSNPSFCSTPYFIAFSIATTCSVLSSVIQPREHFEIMLDCTDRNDQQNLTIKINSISLNSWLSDISSREPAHIPKPFFYWLCFLATQKSEVLFENGESVLIHIPLISTSRPKTKAILFYSEQSYSGQESIILVSKELAASKFLQMVYPTLAFVNYIYLPEDTPLKHRNLITAAVSTFNHELTVHTHHEK